MALGLIPTVIAGGGVALADLRARQAEDAGDEGEQAPLDGSGPPGEDTGTMTTFTTFPVTRWQGYEPARSQEYRASTHHGVDIMFQRRRRGGGGEPGDMYPPATPNGTPLFFMPESVYVVAVADGSIWQSGQSARGNFVVLDHGPPFATYYVHMSSLLVPSGISRGAGKVQVRAGEVLGVVGFDPMDAQQLKHLHLEVWKNGGSESHVDPWPLISGLTILDLPRHVQGASRA